ncbi:MAG: Gfo/Idh/MocA family oxidoreductase [Candidatus Melainabacteria bacterium]|nr:Gfo/Idh/MocA family oxidoreductase [Candidatus Melainabacteria bacterium]
MSKKRIGIIGCGQWGPNQINSFYQHPDAELVRICDIDIERLNINRSIYRNIETTQKVEDIIHAKDIDAVVICTPTATHYTLTKDALENNKDVLCEKPLTTKIEEAEELIKIAKEKGSILMVGHIFLYNTGIIKLKELIKSKECGDIYYMHSQRTNLGPIRNDVNVILDLASHDIYIFNYLLDGKPKVVSVYSKNLLRQNIEDIAFVSLEYPGNVPVHIHVSWLDPKKTREITVVGNKKMITWNDMMARPIEIYSKHLERDPFHYDYGEFHLIAKEGEVLIPYVKNTPPLRAQTEHFMDCIIKRKKPLSDGENGLEVVKTLNEIIKMIKAEEHAQKNPIPQK